MKAQKNRISDPLNDEEPTNCEVNEMKRGLSLFLKAALILMALPVLAGAAFGIYSLLRNPVNPDYVLMLYPIFIGALLSVIPYLFALYQSFRLLNYIDRDAAFSGQSVSTLQKIKISAFLFSMVYILIAPFVYITAEVSDTPELIIMGMVPIFASLVIGMFAAVLQKLLNEIINIKSENELTV
jgi:hypothetical protein